MRRVSAQHAVAGAAGSGPRHGGGRRGGTGAAGAHPPAPAARRLRPGGPGAPGAERAGNGQRDPGGGWEGSGALGGGGPGAQASAGPVGLVPLARRPGVWGPWRRAGPTAPCWTHIPARPRVGPPGARGLSRPGRRAEACSAPEKPVPGGGAAAPRTRAAAGEVPPGVGHARSLGACVRGGHVPVFPGVPAGTSAVTGSVCWSRPIAGQMPDLCPLCFHRNCSLPSPPLLRTSLRTGKSKSKEEITI